MVDDVDDFLAHYGVKGMKWGVRRENTSTTNKQLLSKEEQLARRAKRLDVAKKVAIGAAALAAVGLAAYGVKQTVDYSSAINDIKEALSLGDTPEIAKAYGRDTASTIAKGHEFLRRSNVAETELRGRTYAISDKKDSEGYSSWGQYDIRIRALKDIRLPSTKDKVDTLVEELTKSEIRKMAGDRASVGRKIAYLRSDKKDLATVKLGEITRDQWRGPESEKFIDSLKQKGYSATVDDADSRFYTSASILFDPDAFQYLPPELQSWAK